jgi:hypothetical protein
MRAEAACPPTVPSAAPATPSWSPKMRSGSRTICTSTATTQIMTENRIRPSARTIAENPVENTEPASSTAA